MFTSSKEAINISIIPHSPHNQTEKKTTKKQIKEYILQMRQEIPPPVPIRTDVMWKTSRTLVTKKDPSCQL